MVNENSGKSIIISGGAGKMGELVSDYISTRQDYFIKGIYDPSYKDEKYPNFFTSKSFEVDIIVEFSSSDFINENINRWLEGTSNLIVGSSGLSDESIVKLENDSKDRKIVVIPNFSIGAAFQKLFAKSLSEEFSSMQVIEKHHANKKDAPSGTAIDLANSIDRIDSFEIENSDVIKNVINNINVYSYRDEKYMAEQVVYFKNEFESFNLEHQVFDRKAYLYGFKTVLDHFDILKKYTFGLESIILQKIKI